MASRVVVVGTGTSIGKTHVTSALLLAWLGQGREAVALKPVESGVDGGEEGDQAVLSRVNTLHVKHRAPSDAGAALRAGPAVAGQRLTAAAEQRELFHVKHGGPPVLPTRGLYSFPEPISPHLAARHAGTTIEIDAITGWVDAHRADITLVESAGGLFSPLSRSSDNLDLAVALGPSYVVLVVPDRLGALHETRAASDLALRRGLVINAVVLSAPPRGDDSTGSNADELRWLGLTHTIVSFPRAPLYSGPTARSAALLVSDVERQWLQLCPAG
jgi:dethiobiotin synthetase